MQAKGAYISHTFHEDWKTSILIGINFYKNNQTNLNVQFIPNLETGYLKSISDKLHINLRGYLGLIDP